MMRRLSISFAVAAVVSSSLYCSRAPGGPDVGRAMTMTKMVGGKGGEKIQPRYCESGFVTEIYGTVDAVEWEKGQSSVVITSLGMRCSDGRDLGAMGTAKGKPFSIKNDEKVAGEVNGDQGFTYIYVKYGTLIDSINASVNEQADTRIRSLGSAGGTGGHNSENLEGGSNRKLIGYAGRAGGAVDALQLIFSKE